MIKAPTNTQLLFPVIEPPFDWNAFLRRAMGGLISYGGPEHREAVRKAQDPGHAPSAHFHGGQADPRTGWPRDAVLLAELTVFLNLLTLGAWNGCHGTLHRIHDRHNALLRAANPEC